MSDTVTLHQPGLPIPESTSSAVASTRPTYRLSWRGIMRSEWIKLISTRSTLFTLIASGVVMAAIGMIAAWTSPATSSSGGSAHGLGSSGPLSVLLAGQNLVVLILGVLGVMLGAREYGSGLARTSYAAVPDRISLLVSRIAVFVAACVPVVLIGTLISIVGGNIILDAGGSTTLSFGSDGVLRAVIGTVGYLAGAGVLGICLGTLTRSIGTGVGCVLGLILIIPGIAQLILPDSWSGVVAYLPSQAGTAFTSINAGSDYLGVVAGIAVFVAWVVGMTVLAGAAIRRRDV